MTGSVADRLVRKAPNLPGPFSVLLDLLRLAAATEVFLAHLPFASTQNWRWMTYFASAGHSAVIIFFVLSGYVISWSAQRDGSVLRYGINRAARIYSVVIPAMFLCLFIDIAIPVSTQTPYQFLHPISYGILYLTFSSEFWNLSETMFSNPAFWSLSYEVWYYILFAVWYFGRPRVRWLMLAGALALVGPKIGLLFPLWLLGAFVYYLHKRVSMGTWAARGLMIAGILSGCALQKYLPDYPLNPIFGRNLHYSRSGLNDLAIALSVGVTIFAGYYARLEFLRSIARDRKSVV